jgi:DNA-binding transcriptional LysR family regulator
MVDFEWYRSFIAVYRAGTVTGAAQARHLTQPAVSQHVAALEAYTGHPLFERKPRRMEPTSQGKALYTHLAPSMDTLESVSNTLHQIPVQETPTIRLGAPFDYFHARGWYQLKDVQFRLRVEFGETDKLIEGIGRGRLDGAITTQQITAPHIDYTKIGTEEFCLIAPAQAPNPEGVTADSLRDGSLERFLLDYPWISYSEELPIIRRFWQAIFGKRPDLVPVAVVPSLLMIQTMVESGRGISVLPRYICEHSLQQGRLKELWQPKESISNDLWIATRKVDRNKPEISQLKSFMTADCQK